MEQTRMEEGEDAGGNRAGARPPPGPPEQTDFWEDEDRIRSLMSMCYDDGVYPTDLDHEEMQIQGREVSFKLNTSLDEIKVKWLKERMVSVIFKENARFLAQKVKDDIIRALEDRWVLGSERFTAEARRGRIKIEGPYALSYVAKSREVVAFMISEGGVDIPLRNVEYKVQFKPWMTKAEFKDLRRQEDKRTFWVLAIQVPLDVYAQIQKAMARLRGPPSGCRSFETSVS
ncbi:hypothetical protein CBR_g34163 [Chara braunii]|uniref:Uncharacterized protein n=1 Tax=Chara braunii TaxID=69332 RepID=A0A388LIC0_CHABU|nr:hypothetical protein CBR_g34163 [Chara braunii]|eukprot:GBG81983.1 hypothetical protein CBR_g34163 [Chara braunii]